MKNLQEATERICELKGSLVALDASGASLPFPILRLGFGLLFILGVWLTFIGWIVDGRPAEPTASDR